MLTENEYEPIIHRTSGIQDVRNNFRDILGVLQDITNYGSNLIPRCIVSSSRKLEDAIILGTLVRQAVAMIDSAEILISHAAVYPANLQIRALFEVSVYIDWILLGNTEEKCKYFYVSSLRDQKNWAMRTQNGSQEYEDYVQAMGTLGDAMREIGAKNEDIAKKYIVEIDTILSKPTFAPINQIIDNHKKKARMKYEPAWYQPLKMNSVRQLAVAISRLPEYEIIYSPSSDVMHTSGYNYHMSFKDGTLHITPIRHLKGISTAIQAIVTQAIQIYRAILRHYRREELENFSRKYAEHWRQPFISIKKVVYADVKPSRII